MLKTFSLTDIGRKRKLNQDYVFTQEQPVGNLSNLFIVADGMGGHTAGDYASRVAVETIVREVEGCFEKNPMQIFEKAIGEANQRIHQKAAENEDMEGMGTTVVVASLIGRYLQVANVGDSRCIGSFKNGKIQKDITLDHKPNTPYEKERIIKNGGKIYQTQNAIKHRVADCDECIHRTQAKSVNHLLKK